MAQLKLRQGMGKYIEELEARFKQWGNALRDEIIQMEMIYQIILYFRNEITVQREGYEEQMKEIREQHATKVAELTGRVGGLTKKIKKLEAKG